MAVISILTPRAVACAAALAVSLALLTPATATASQLVGVIVRERAGASGAAARAIYSAGGTIDRRIEIVRGFTARVPRSEIPSLARSSAVEWVTPDRPIHLHHAVDGFDGASDAGSLYATTNITGAADMWTNGYTGAGVDIALLDTGVTPVDGLRTPGKVVNGADLSLEAPADNLRYLDTYGHGTHLAGIIAGRDDGVVQGQYAGDHDNLIGMAPDARLVNVKVANSQGATDVSEVLAAMDWIVQHRTDNGLNIRVLNISFGSDSSQQYQIDPLSYAAEVAWRRGLVVVAAAGNGGELLGRLTNPARDPYVVAVGAVDSNGSTDYTLHTIPSWSGRGDGTRNPDLLAPGKSIVSLRDPGSYLDAEHPEGRVNARLFRGSGTSQAAAVVSGAAALLLQQRPWLMPDQVKALMTSTAAQLPGATPREQGAGELNLRAASAAPAPGAAQTFPASIGDGTLEGARGSLHVVSPDGVELSGERDIFGNAWDGASWASVSNAGTSWSGGSWNGVQWSGASWSGASWSGASWSGASWSGASWSGASWSGASWSGASWSGASWSGASWSGASWSGGSWSSVSWGGDYDKHVKFRQKKMKEA